MWKDRLRDFRRFLRESQQIKDQLRALEGQIYAPKAQQFTAMPHGQGGEHRSMDELAIRHAELQELYRGQLAAVEAEQLAIEKAMMVLTPEQRKIIRLYYFDALKWEDVCVRASYEWAQTHRLHAAALRALEEAEHGKA